MTTLLAVDDAYLSRVVGLLLQDGSVVSVLGVEAGTSATPDIAAVLTAGHDAAGQDLVGLNAVNIFSTAYIGAISLASDFVQFGGQWESFASGWSLGAADSFEVDSNTADVSVQETLSLDCLGSKLTLDGVDGVSLQAPFGAVFDIDTAWDVFLSNGTNWVVQGAWHLETSGSLDWAIDGEFSFSFGAAASFFCGGFVDWEGSSDARFAFGGQLELLAGAGTLGGLLFLDSSSVRATWPDSLPSVGQVLTVASVTDANNIVLEWA